MDLLTPRLHLRRWRPSDLPSFAAINADPAVMAHFPSTLTTEESAQMIQRFEAHHQQHGFGPCAAELRSTGECIGFVGLGCPTWQTDFTPCVEIAWRLSQTHWGQGLATEAAQACLHYAFHQLNLLEIVAFTVPANIASRRVMEKLGMRHSGQFAHPRLPHEHPLSIHLLYRLPRP